MTEHIIDLMTYPRRQHFTYFNQLANPYAGITVNVDMTELSESMKRRNLPFFLTVCYAVSKAANLVPEFRQRIRDGQIVEYSYCRTSHTVALPDGTYCYCVLDSEGHTLESFLSYGREEQDKVRMAPTIEEDPQNTEDLLYLSTLPWISYTALVNPTPVPADSHPRITWGKTFTQGDRVLLPMTVLCNHALVDGLHMAQFYQHLDEQFRLLSR